MDVLFSPWWDEDTNREIYKVIIGSRNGDVNESKVSMGFEFNEFTYCVISIENGVLSLSKECWNDYGPNDYTNLVDDGIARKDDLDEITEVLRAFGEKYREIVKKQEDDKRKQELAKRQREWLNSPAYQVEIKGWEW